MAKDVSFADKPSKLTKKKSQQDLAANMPLKSSLKKTKHADEPAPTSTPAVPSSSKSKKDKKPKDVAYEVKAFAPDAGKPAQVGKKDKKRASAVVPKSAPAQETVKETSGKRKRNVESTAEKLEPTKETVTQKPVAAEGKAEEKTKKRKAVVAEEKPKEGVDKKKKRNEAEAQASSKEVVTPESKTNKKSKRLTSAEESPVPVQSPPKTTRKSKVKGAKPAPEPEVEHDQEPTEKADAEGEEEEEEFHGFSSDDDSSDEDEMLDEIPGVDVGKLPTIAKDDATVKRKLEKAKRKPTGDLGVIFLGRIPHGFYEDQMREYFSQFGTVTRLRLSRNKKTGKSKHYGFVEFDSSSVAQIVAETMDNYLLMGHILTCKVIPKDQVHPELWVGANRKWRTVPRDRLARIAHNRPRTEDELGKAEARLLERQEQRKRKLAEAGIEYDFEAVAYKKKSKPTEA